MILIVTGKDDLTTDYFIRRLEQRHLSFFRFNTEDLLSDFEVSLRLGSDSADLSLIDISRHVEVRLADITAAYFRKPQVPIGDGQSEASEQAFNRRELSETLRSIWRLIPDEKWLNAPEALWLAGNKVKQLKIATELGFRTPPTLISSNSREVLKFIETHDRKVIAKAVKHAFINCGDTMNLLFTSALDQSDLTSIATATSLVPSIFQPRLDKKCDLRVTVVGDSVFPVALLSQQNAETSVDWRAWDVTGVDLVHERFDLPENLRVRCIELNRRFNLRFSCIDMVQVKNGDFYFLEVNPNGQWAWIEEMVRFPIRESIIDLLAGPSHA